MGLRFEESKFKVLPIKTALSYRMLYLLAKSRVRPALNHKVSRVLKFKFDITRGLFGRAPDKTYV